MRISICRVTLPIRFLSPFFQKGQTALFFCSFCKDPETVWRILTEANCDIAHCDKRDNPAVYYLQNPSEIAPPEEEQMSTKGSGKDREYLGMCVESNVELWEILGSV